MIKTIIIEDELRSRQALRQILEEFIEDITMVGEAESVAQSIPLLKEKEVDLVFMDIHLPDGESFDILDALVEEELDFEIIFITAYTDVKVKAFDYFFLQYLTKPFDIDKIEKAVNHYRKNTTKKINGYQDVLRDVIKNEANLIPVPNSKGIQFVKIHDIVRLEADRNYTNIYTIKGERFMASKNIKHFSELLDSSLFYRVHKSHIINIKFLTEVSKDGEIKMQDGSFAPLAKRVRKEFLDIFKA